LTACRPKIKNNVKLILFFEILSSTEWNVASKKLFFNPNWYEDITKYLNIKIKAIKCYKKELRKSPHPRSLETIKLYQYLGEVPQELKMQKHFS